MKKNTMMRIASVLLVAVLITTCAISGTFAKYISTVEGSGTAAIAKWAFTLDGVDGNFAEAESFSFNLYETLMDTLNDQAEGDVKAGVIAPGTYGSFALALTNDSEVTATYSIDFGVEDNFATVAPARATALRAGLNIKFAVAAEMPDAESEDWKTMTEFQEAVANGTLAFDDGNGETNEVTEATVTVFWMWEYETGADAIETELGILAAGATAPAITVTADITVTQAN